MKVFKTAVLLCFFLVTGCGGGSNDFDLNEDMHTVTIPSGFRVIETLFDGQSAVRFFVPSEPSVYTGIVEDQTVASELYYSTLQQINDIKSTKSGDRFYVERTAVSSEGKNVSINVTGLDLTSDGSEYASRLFIEIDGGHSGYLMSGTPVETLPNAKARYQGFVEVIVVDGATTRQEGNFQLDIDFSKAVPSGALSASTKDYGFAASSIRVDAEAAEFTADDAVIGPKGYEVAATIYANIVGTRGQGAAGVITSTGNTSVGYLGTFVGKR